MLIYKVVELKPAYIYNVPVAGANAPAIAHEFAAAAVFVVNYEIRARLTSV